MMSSATLSNSVASAYAPVSQADEGGGDLGAPLGSNDHSSPPRTTTFTHIAQARDLSWKDPYYDGKHGIVAAFDRDTELAAKWFMWRFLSSAFFFWGLAAFYWILGVMDLKYSQEATVLDDICGFYMMLLGGLFGILAIRGRQAQHGQHVAVTTEGIRLDSGSMVTVTIPFEHIQKCEVQPFKICFREPGPQLVTVARSAAPLEQFCCTKTRKVELFGILRPQEFVDLVHAMKASEEQGTYEAAAPRVELQQMD